MNKLSISVLALVILAQGCVWSAHSRTSTPYGQSQSRQVCLMGNCFSMSNQDIQATVNTPGYQACVQNFAADNARAAGCSGDASTCTAPQYSQVQIMDACTIRAAYLNGGMGYGGMPIPGFNNWYGANFGMTAGYDMQRQQVLYGPQFPVVGQMSTPGSLSDAELEAELLRRHQALAEQCRRTPNAEGCSSARR